MADAIEIADLVLAETTVPVERPDGEKSQTELINESSREGILLQRDTVRLVQAQLDARGAEIDVRLLRAGNEAAMHLRRDAIRLAEDQFKARRSDVLEGLLEELKAQRAKDGAGG